MIDAGLHAHVEGYVAELGACLERSNQRDLNKHLKRMTGFEGRKADDEQYIKDEDGNSPRDNGRIREQSAGIFRTILNTKSLKFELTISEQFPR